MTREAQLPNVLDTLWGYSIIGSGFTVNLGSDSLGKSSSLPFGFIVNPYPDLIIE